MEQAGGGQALKVSSYDGGLGVKNPIILQNNAFIHAQQRISSSI